MGHYDGYTKEDFERLLQVLSGIKGKFILSSHPSPILTKFVKSEGWKQDVIEQTVSFSRIKTNLKKKFECLTRNF